MKTKNIKFPNLRKDLKTFLLSEEGKMTKKDLAKMTAVVVATAGAIGVAMKAADSQGACGSYSHNSHASGCSAMSW